MNSLTATKQQIVDFFTQTPQVGPTPSMKQVLDNRRMSNMKILNIPEPQTAFNYIPYQPSYNQELLRGQVQLGLDNYLFFSHPNLESIQKQLIYNVYQETQYKIDPQSGPDLLNIMRNVYLEYMNVEFSSVTHEIECLNQKVLEIATEQVVYNLKAYLYYMDDLKHPKLVGRPQSSNITGSLVTSLFQR